MDGSRHDKTGREGGAGARREQSDTGMQSDPETRRIDRDSIRKILFASVIPELLNRNSQQS
ncbi:MAG: hypothetical protein AAF638_10095 [Pseudomonadota bacterium]